MSRPVQQKRKADDNYCLADITTTTMAETPTTTARQANKTRIVRQNSRPSNEVPEVSDRIKLGITLKDSVVPYFKVLRKLKQTIIRSEHHSTFLQRCIDEEQTPKGLRSKITSQIPEQSIAFTLRWEDAHRRFATELTTQLCEYYKDRALISREQFQDNLEKLKELCNEETTLKITEYLDRLAQDLEASLADRRTKKLQKVREDSGASRNAGATSSTSPNTL